MNVHIGCPNCKASLKMPDTMYGRRVKCPKCGEPFQCPPAPGQPEGAPAGKGNLFSFEDPQAGPVPTLAAANPADPAGATPASGLPRTWSQARKAIRLLVLGTLIYIAACCVVPYFHFENSGTYQKPPAWVFWTYWGAFVALCLIALAFPALAGTASRQSGMTWLGLTTLLAVSLCSAGFIMALSAAGQIGDYRVVSFRLELSPQQILQQVVLRADDAARQYRYIDMSALLATGCAVAGIVLFMTNLARLAQFLGNSLLARGFHGWISLFLLHPFLLAIYACTMTIRERYGMDPSTPYTFQRVPMAAAHAVLAGLFLLLVWRLSASIHRAHARGRL